MAQKALLTFRISPSELYKHHPDGSLFEHLPELFHAVGAASARPYTLSVSSSTKSLNLAQGRSARQTHR